MTLKATSKNVIFKWVDEPNLKAGEIDLIHPLKRDVGWAEVVVSGSDSVLKPGDPILLSRRVTTYHFEWQGIKLGNTSDASILGYKRKNELYCTEGTTLFTWLEPEDEYSGGGILLVKKESTKELDVRKAVVNATGPKSGVKPGDIILLAYNKDSYVFEIDGKVMSNCGAEAIICYYTA